MKTGNEILSNPNLQDPSLVDDPTVHIPMPQKKQIKTGIGGCLVYPLIFLIAQPFLFLYMLATSLNNPPPMTSYRIFWPYMLYDLAPVGVVLILLASFVRKKAVLPALFVFFLVSFSILSGLVANIFWRLPAARVIGRDPLLSHLVILFQCLLLVPYFILDGRVKNTFVQKSTEQDIVDQLVRPIAPLAERLYRWLARGGKKVILYTFVFIVLVFVFDWFVDSVVLHVFLS